MIRNETEYREALQRLDQDRTFADQQRAGLVRAGLRPDEVDRGMEPVLSFQAQLAEEVEWYEHARRGEIPSVYNLTHVGRQLIALRIAKGISQRELAERLGVSEAVVSRDERNEYHNVTVTRAQKVIEALRGDVITTLSETPGAHDLVPAGYR